MVDPADWDLNKENIKPIPEGRISSEIVSGDNQHQSSTLQEEIEYVYWAEQKYVSSGKKVFELLERCLKTIKMDPSIFNDDIYVTLWIKYAKLSEKQLDIYHFMFNNDIGSEHIRLFKAWAHSMEINGQYGKAIEIFKLGINRNIKDGDKLLIYLGALNERIKQAKIPINFPTSDPNNSLLSTTVTNSTLINDQPSRRRKAFNSLVEYNKYEESMDRISHSKKAEPYVADSSCLSKNSSQPVKSRQVSLEKKRELSATDVYREKPKELNNEILADNLLKSQSSEVKDSLKERWSRPYIVSEVDADNVVPVTKISNDMILPKPSLEKSTVTSLPKLTNSASSTNSLKRNDKPVSIFCNNNANDSTAKTKTSVTVSVAEIYLEKPSLICVVNEQENDSSISNVSSSKIASTFAGRRFRHYSFKYSKMSDEMKNITENPPPKDQSNKSKVLYIISPEMDYVGQEKEYSFEELLAAKYKKYKRSNR